jgi:hypothetical protein
MWNYYSIEHELQQRHADDLRRAAREHLLQQARQARSAAGGRGPGPYQRLVYWFGGRLVFWGSRLQSHVERPELERVLATAC